MVLKKSDHFQELEFLIKYPIKIKFSFKIQFTGCYNDESLLRSFVTRTLDVLHMSLLLIPTALFRLRICISKSNYKIKRFLYYRWVRRRRWQKIDMLIISKFMG